LRIASAAIITGSDISRTTASMSLKSSETMLAAKPPAQRLEELLGDRMQG
jgi:hypothetical protein